MVPKGGEEGRGRGVVSLAKRYEEDEEACFARIKELWQEKVGWFWVWRCWFWWLFGGDYGSVLVLVVLMEIGFGVMVCVVR